MKYLRHLFATHLIMQRICRTRSVSRSDAGRESHVRSQEIASARREGRPLLKFSRIVIEPFNVGTLRESHVQSNFRADLNTLPSHHAQTTRRNSRGWRKNSLTYLLYSVHPRAGVSRSHIRIMYITPGDPLSRIMLHFARQPLVYKHSHASNKSALRCRVSCKKRTLGLEFTDTHFGF